MSSDPASRRRSPLRSGRALLCLGLFGCFDSGSSPRAGASAAAGSESWPLRDPRLGAWGEEAARVPSFALRQESRAPKLPDADQHFAQAPTGAAGPFGPGSLLICLAEIYPADRAAPALYRYKLGAPDPSRALRAADWDSLNAPDARVSLRLRGEHPITLYGPEDHWGFYLSVPHIQLQAGDAIEVRLWDRDSASDEFIGEARARFDGALPITLRAPYFALQCRVMPAAQVLRAAAPLLSAVDQRLAQAAAWRPDAQRWELGRILTLELLQRNWVSPNLRYLAGFLGWESPSMRERLGRVAALEAQQQRLRRDLVAELRQRAPGPRATVALGARTLRVTPLGPARAAGSAGVAPGPCAAAAECVVELSTAAPAGDLCAALQLAGLRDDGAFLPAPALDAASAEPCQRAEASAQRLQVRVPAGASLLWVGRDYRGQVLRLY